MLAPKRGLIHLPKMDKRQTLPEGRIAELSIFCRNLRDKDWFSKSDPFVLLFMYLSPAMEYELEAFYEFREICKKNRPECFERQSTVQVGPPEDWCFAGETEVVWNELSPAFIGKFLLPYDTVTQRAARLRFEVYDMDNDNGSLDKQDFLGAAECTLPQIFDVRPRVKTMMLADRRMREKAKYGKIVVSGDVYDVHLPQHLMDIKVRFCIGNEMPHREQIFCVISRRVKYIVEGDEELWTRIHRSGALTPPANHGTREFGFQDVTLSEEQLTGGDDERPLRIELFIHRNNGAHVRIGGTTPFTFAGIAARRGNGQYQFVPDLDSGAGLQFGEMTVNTQIVKRKGRLVRSDDGTVKSFMSGSSTNSMEGEPLAGLDTSVIVFRFARFAWSQPTAKRPSLLSYMKATKI